MPHFAGAIRDRGWAGDAELEAVAAGCAAWSGHPDAFAAVVMVEACGVVPDRAGGSGGGPGAVR